MVFSASYIARWLGPVELPAGRMSMTLIGGWAAGALLARRASCHSDRWYSPNRR